MEEEFESFSSLYTYLSILEAELDLKIKQTMLDVKKLQDIYETIKPVEDTAPKENKQVPPPSHPQLIKDSRPNSRKILCRIC